MYQVSLENVERFLSHDLILKICDDTDDGDDDDDDDTKGTCITIARVFFFQKQTNSNKIIM